jgi:uncharacterized protein YaiL (DUF2058 family)
MKLRGRMELAKRSGGVLKCSPVQSLRDKLLKAGLVTADQAQEAEKKRDALPRRDARPRPAPDDEGGPIRRLPPLPGSPAAQRLQSLKQQELDRQLRELAHLNEVPREDGARTFHFLTRKGKLRRIDLSDAQGKKLEEGALAIVESPEPGQIEHVLVPAQTAEAMVTLSDKSVRFWNRAGAPIGFEDSEAPQAD